MAHFLLGHVSKLDGGLGGTHRASFNRIAVLTLEHPALLRLRDHHDESGEFSLVSASVVYLNFDERFGQSLLIYSLTGRPSN